MLRLYTFFGCSDKVHWIDQIPSLRKLCIRCHGSIGGIVFLVFLGVSVFLLILAIAIGFTIISGILGDGAIHLDFGDTALTITGPQKDTCTVDYQNILSLDILSLEDPGAAVSGSENDDYRWGTWENETFGTYSLFAAKSVTQHILITTEDGSYIVFNYDDDATTVSILDMFTQLLASKS